MKVLWTKEKDHYSYKTKHNSECNCSPAQLATLYIELKSFSQSVTSGLILVASSKEIVQAQVNKTVKWNNVIKETICLLLKNYNLHKDCGTRMNWTIIFSDTAMLCLDLHNWVKKSNGKVILMQFYAVQLARFLFLKTARHFLCIYQTVVPTALHTDRTMVYILKNIYLS